MLKHYITLAFRNLQRNKFQSLFSIVGLAVAFFCFGLFAYFVHALTSPDEWAANHDRMVYLTSSDYLRNTLDMNAEELEQIKNLPEVESICQLMDEQYAYFLYGEDYRDLRTHTITADTTFHHMFNPRLIAGSWNDVLQSENSFAMCESCAKRCFGSAEEAIGQSLLLSSGFNYTVRAVVEDLPQNNTIAFMYNIGGYLFNDIKQRNLWGTYYVMAKEGYSREQLKTAINQLGLSHSTDYFHGEVIKASKPAVITPLCEEAMGGKAGLWFGFSLVSLIIMLPGLLILLSALSNFFHLLLSNIMMRRREYVLRRAHGAHTWHLWLMVSTQVVITMFLVGLASLLIVDIVAPLLQFNVNSNLITFDTHLMLVQDLEHIAILLVIGLVVAWLAVARIRRDSLQEAMKTSTGARPSRHILRNILLCWQLVVGCFFITILAAVYLQLGQNQQSTLPQFTKSDKENILLFVISRGENDEFGSALDAELNASPDVERFATSSNYTPFMGGWKEYMIDERGDTLMISFVHMNQQQFEFLSIPLLSGEWARQEDEAVADPDFLKRYHLELGDQISVVVHYFQYNDQGAREEVYQDHTYRITGVVDCRMSDFNHNVTGGSDPDPGIFVFSPNNSIYWVKCRPGTVEKVKQLSKDALDKAGLRMDMNFDTLKHNIDRQFEGITQFIPIFWLFCFIALAIALLGIYSAITVDTTYRRKEMAIRKINGAKSRHIATLFARLYIRLLVIAAAIAFPLAYLLIDGIVTSNFLTTFNHGFGFYLGIFLLVAAFVALTVGVQIWRISRIEPASVVKSE